MLGKINLAEKLGLTYTGPRTGFFQCPCTEGAHTCLFIIIKVTRKKLKNSKVTDLNFGKSKIPKKHFHLRLTRLRKAFPFHRAILTIKASIFVSMFTNSLSCHQGVNIQPFILQKAGSQVLLKYQFLFQKSPKSPSASKQASTTR